MKKLSEEQAWGALQVHFRKRFGVCYAIALLQEYGLITDETTAAMQRRIGRERNRLNCVDTYLWGCPGDENKTDGHRFDFSVRMQTAAQRTAVRAAARRRAKRRAA